MAETYGLKVKLNLTAEDSDIAAVKRKVANAFKSIGIGVKGGGGGGGKTTSGGGDKGEASLVSMAGGVAVLVALFTQIKPVQDLLKVFLGFATLGLLKIVKWVVGFADVIGGLGTFLMKVFEADIIMLKDDLIAVLNYGWEILKLIPSGLWEAMKGNGFDEFKEKISKLGLDLQAAFVANAQKFKDSIFGATKDLSAALTPKINATTQAVIAIPAQIARLMPRVNQNDVRTVTQAISNNITKNTGSAALGEGARIAVESAYSVAKTPKEMLDLLSGTKYFTKVNDAIITKDGKVIQTSPDDTITASKGGGGGGGKTLNFYGVTPQEMMEYIRRELGPDYMRSGVRF